MFYIEMPIPGWYYSENKKPILENSCLAETNF